MLAWVEELHVLQVFGEAYAEYKSETAFLIPFVVTQRRWLEVIVSIGTPMLLLGGLVMLNGMLYP